MLHFNSLVRRLSEASGLGMISFDLDKRIVDATTPVHQWLEIGQPIDAQLAQAANRFGWKNWPEIIDSVLTSQQVVHFSALKTELAGQTRYLDLTLAPILDARKHLLGGGAIISDVTAKTVIELQAQDQQRAQAVARTASRVAHELNNPLDGILRYVNLSLRALDGQPEKARPYLLQARDGLMRMARIIEQMLTFSRADQPPYEYQPLDAVAQQAAAALAGSLENIQFELARDYQGPCLSVRSEPMFQVFCNLFKNAADAMQGNGTLTVRIGRDEQGWRVSVADTGGGFDPALAEEIFKPFFTTKPPGQGTGLGLAICRDILDKMNGKIEARNIPGGSEFIVTLPDNKI